MTLSSDAIPIKQEMTRLGLDDRWLANKTQREVMYVERVLLGVLPGCGPFFQQARKALEMTATTRR